MSKKNIKSLPENAVNDGYSDTMKIGGSCLMVFAVSLGCVFDNKMTDGIINGKTVWFLFFMPFCYLFFAVAMFKSHLKMTFNTFDFFIISFFIYIVSCNSVCDGNLASKENLEDFALLSFYFVVKILLCSGLYSNKLLVTGVLFLTFSQILVAGLQWFMFFPSFNNSFRFTGFFFNPAPFSIYLTCLLIVCLIVSESTSSKLIRYFSIALFLSGLPVIMITQSRAAWIALSTALIYLSLPRIYALIVPYWQSKFSKVFLILSLLFGLALSGTYLYQLKKNSADGRLLIYKVSGLMVLDHPVFGSGGGSFQAMFLKYQSEYFRHHPEKMKTEGKLADQVWYAFNDLLQVTVEHGLVSLFLLLLIFMWLVKIFAKKQIFTFQKSRSLFRCALVCIVVIVISGFFSYPLEMLPIQVIFMASLAVLSNDIGLLDYRTLIKAPIFIKAPYKLFVQILFCLIAFFLFVKSMWIYSAFKISKFKEDSYAAMKYDDILHKYPWYVANNTNLLLKQGNITDAINELQNAQKKNTDPVFYYALAKIYISEKQFNQAENEYKFLYYALPGYLRPKFLLAKLYFVTGQENDWELMVKEILAFRSKIPSRAVDNMIFEIENMKRSKEYQKILENQSLK